MFGGRSGAHTLTSLARGEEAMLGAATGRSARPSTVTLDDGTTGWCIRAPRADDCWQAVVATALQVPIEDVPDSRIDERLEDGESADEIGRSYDLEFREWLRGQRLRMTRFAVEPGRLPKLPRWIGQCPVRGDFQDHCLVMSGPDVLFDPIVTLEDQLGRKVKAWGADDVRIGYAFHGSD